jgi:hypothetical protein
MPLDQEWCSRALIEVGFALPASTEGFVESDDRQQSVSLRACKTELRRKQLLLGFEDFKVAGFADCVALGGKLQWRPETKGTETMGGANQPDGLLTKAELARVLKVAENGGSDVGGWGSYTGPVVGDIGPVFLAGCDAGELRAKAETSNRAVARRG